MRAAFRLSLIFALTGPLFALYLVARVVLIPFPQARRRFHDRVLTTWARACARCIGMKLVIEGRPPEPPFFLVSNHLSYVDVVAYLSCLKGTFLAKSEIAGWPLLGMLARGVGTLFIDRTRKRDLLRVREVLERELKSGRGLIVFPESTSSAGDAVLPFKASTLEVPVELDLPVHCASIRYDTPEGCEPARTAVCWWGDMRLTPHLVKLAALPGFTGHIRFASEPVRATDRKELAAAAHAVVTELLREGTPVREAS